ncbi:hypothetical protein BDK92_0650 [Micromonospora pisi]|uniref:Uncharacterized protein n=1 Tax=Micromonospora pisi TaxID=589240 RepID=A0A495JBY3_9ACTN|nr:hypothetical protein BDK92_0650 [Micromonospora pisi]
MGTGGRHWIGNRRLTQEIRPVLLLPWPSR